MSDTPGPSSSTSTAGTFPEGVKLTHHDYCDIDLKVCIICQKRDKRSRVSSTPNGRDKIKHAGEIRQDIVAKRLKTINDQDYVYHVDTCYKVYTMKKSLDAISQKAGTGCLVEVVDMEVEQDHQENEPSMSLRSEKHSRSKPSSNTNSASLPCIICGNVTVTVKREKIREKFRICERERAELFLSAARHNCDEVFERVSDIYSVEGVFAADLYCHKTCILKYLLNYQRTLEGPSESVPIISPKRAIFQEALKHIDPLLEKDYGFTVSEITAFMLSLNTFDDDLNIQNRDVKQLLVEHYGDRVQFAKNPRRNASEMVYSSKLSQSDLVVKMKNLDVLRQAGTLLRTLLQKIDFGLGDKFCDAEEIKDSWEKTQMPDELLTFFSSLFNIPKAGMAKIQALMQDLEEDYSDDSDEEDCNEDETAENSVRTLHTQLHCLFQVMTYHIHKGRQKTPMHAMVGQSVYSKTRSRVLITTLNRIGVSTSYNEVRRARSLLSSYDCYMKGKSLNELPPTSSAIRGHIQRSFFVIRNAITLLDEHYGSLDPKDFGWTSDSGVLVPEKLLHPIPPDILVLCQCSGKCDRCKCRSNASDCVPFCHKGNEVCVNRH